MVAIRLANRDFDLPTLDFDGLDHRVVHDFLKWAVTAIVIKAILPGILDHKQIRSAVITNVEERNSLAIVTGETTPNQDINKSIVVVIEECRPIVMHRVASGRVGEPPGR